MVQEVFKGKLFEGKHLIRAESITFYIEGKINDKSDGIQWFRNCCFSHVK
jgi:hypothetical protein